MFKELDRKLLKELDAGPFYFKLCLRQVDGPRHEVRDISIACSGDNNLSKEENKKFVNVLDKTIGLDSSWFLIHDDDDEIIVYCKQREEF